MSHTADKFHSQLSSHRRGARLVYHIGDLSFDRLHNMQVDALAEVVWRAYEHGQVLLFRKRVSQPMTAAAPAVTNADGTPYYSPPVFNYIAVKL